jgi:hypothetical protein
MAYILAMRVLPRFRATLRLELPVQGVLVLVVALIILRLDCYQVWPKVDSSFVP